MGKIVMGCKALKRNVISFSTYYFLMLFKMTLLFLSLSTFKAPTKLACEWEMFARDLIFI